MSGAGAAWPAPGSRSGTAEPPLPFGDRLAAAVGERESQIVLGIDPDPVRLWPDAVAAGDADADAAALGVAMAATGRAAGPPHRGRRRPAARCAPQRPSWPTPAR